MTDPTPTRDEAVRAANGDNRPFPNYEVMPDPTDEMLASPQFEAIWNVIKSWDVNVPEAYSGYCGGNGSHVAMILKALASAPAPAGGGVDEPTSFIWTDELYAACEAMGIPVQFATMDKLVILWRGLTSAVQFASLSPAATPVSEAEPVREAAQALIASRSSTYKARNGRVMGIEDDSGEMMWIVPFDEMHALEEALAKPASSPAGGGEP